MVDDVEIIGQFEHMLRRVPARHNEIKIHQAFENFTLEYTRNGI